MTIDELGSGAVTAAVEAVGLKTQITKCQRSDNPGGRLEAHCRMENMDEVCVFCSFFLSYYRDFSKNM